MPTKKKAVKKDGSNYLGTGMASRAAKAKKSRNARLRGALSSARNARKGK